LHRYRVGSGRSPEHGVEHDSRSTDAGTSRGIARTIEDVMVATIAHDPAFEKWVDRDRAKEGGRDAHRNQDCEGNGCAEYFDFPAGRHKPESTIKKGKEPQRASSRRRVPWVRRSVVPYRVDGHGGRNPHEHSHDKEEQPSRLGPGPLPNLTDSRSDLAAVRVGSIETLPREALPGKPRLPVPYDKHPRNHVQGHEYGRQRKHVKRVERSNRIPGEGASEDERRQPRADDRN
jgi:hypothetical protein